MNRLDINKIHRRGGLLEGAITKIAPATPRSAAPGNSAMLVAGLGVLFWRGQEIAWERQPIIRNSPKSWGGSGRDRPKFLCPACGRGCYHLYAQADGRLGCRVCAEVPCPSRLDSRRQEPALFRRLAKLRLALGVRDPTMLCDLPPPPRAPRSRWLFYRRVAKLRLLELKLLGASLEDYFGRLEPRPGPAKAASGSSRGDQPKRNQ